MRKGDTHRKEAIRMIRAAVQNAEIEWQRPATDEDVQGLIAREIKRRVEAIELFPQGSPRRLGGLVKRSKWPC